MSTRDIIDDWTTEKLDHEYSRALETREVSHVFKKQCGGRVMYAGLTLSVSPADSLALAIEGALPDEYRAAVRNGILSLLMGHYMSPMLGMKVIVSDCDVHEIDSSYAAFYLVANEAIRLALAIDDAENCNVAWS